MAEGKEVYGTIIEELANSLYRVRIDIALNEVLCYVAGRMKKNNIHVKLGDRVRVVLDPYGGKATNRIVFRV